MADKTYINGIIIKTKTFDDGGEILKCSVKADEFAAELLKHTDSNGWVNVDICRRKTPSDKGQTHYMVLNQRPARQQEGDRLP